jgi:Heat shock factor binding protein 1
MLEVLPSSSEYVNVPQPMVVFVTQTLTYTPFFQNLEFKSVGDKIMGRMHDMESRFDELEHSIVLLLDQAGLNSSNSNNIQRSQQSVGGGSVPSRVGGIGGLSPSPLKPLLSPLRGSPNSVCTSKGGGTKMSVAI